MAVPYPVALSALRVLANRDDRAPLLIAVEWGKALIAAGYDHASIVDLAAATDAGATRALLGRVLARFNLADLTDLEKARLARGALTQAFLNEQVTAPIFATRLVAFFNDALNDVGQSDAFAREYRFLFEVDEVFNVTLANAQQSPQWSANLALDGIDPGNPRAWVLRRMRQLGFIDAGDAPLDPRW